MAATTNGYGSDKSCDCKSISAVNSPKILIAVKSIYAFTVLIFIMGWNGTHNTKNASIHELRKSFSFFTILCYWGEAFYFAVAAVYTFCYALNGGVPPLNRYPRILQALHHLFFSTVVTFPFLVTIVYWGVLYASIGPFTSTFALWSNVSEHGLNSAFALFELVFSRIEPSPWVHLPFLILLLCGYLGVAYLTLATKHYYVYSFLNPNPAVTAANGDKSGGVGSNAMVAAFVVGIAVAICIIFTISRYVQVGKIKLVEKKMGLTGKMYGGRSTKEHSQVNDGEEMPPWTGDSDSKAA